MEILDRVADRAAPHEFGEPGKEKVRFMTHIALEQPARPPRERLDPPPWDTIFRQPKQRVLWQPMTSTRWPESATLAPIQSGCSRRQAKPESHLAEFPQH